MFAKLRQSLRFLVVKQVRMVAHFPQLDQDVLVVGHRVAFFNALLLEQVAVNLLLLLSDAHIHVNFHLGLKRSFDLLLNSSKQEWPHYTVKLLNNLFVALFFIFFGDTLLVSAV